jgi:hypothetical protein
VNRQIIAVAVVAMLLIPGLALAQVCNFDLRYDCSSVTTITGKIVTTVNYNPSSPMTGPQAFIVQSANQTYTVFLGPGWYVSQLGLAASPGQTITATGSLRTICNATYLVVQNVAWNNQIYVIRNANGVPLWSIIAVSPSMGAPMPPYGTYGRGPSGPAIPFDPNNMVNLQGNIISMSTMQTADSCDPLLVATIRTTSGTPCPGDVQVLLAPQSFFATNGWNLAQGACITVSGSSVTCNNQNYIVATSINMSNRSLLLRNNSGIPQFATGYAPMGAGPSGMYPTGACPACGTANYGTPTCPSCGTVCPPTGAGPYNQPGTGYMVVPPPPPDMCQ